MGISKPTEGGPSGPKVTEELVDFVAGLKWSAVPAEARHAAKRHLLDTIGAMMRGAQGDITVKSEAVFAAVRGDGSIPVPGRSRRSDLLDAAYLSGISAHGIELDDGFREAALHPGAPVVSTLLPLAYSQPTSGTDLLLALTAGYQAMLSIGQACHPALRRRGFHPTAVIGTFGSVVAATKLLGLSKEEAISAMGLAASSAAGLHSYVNGGGDVKRLHAGHAAREGLQAALLARQGIAGPPTVLEGKDGFFQAFAAGAETKPIDFSSGAPLLITRCYMKPFACCRHLQPAAEALIAIVTEQDLDASDIERIIVETYNLAGELAEVGWDDFATAQLSFRFIVAVAATYRGVDLEHFEPRFLKDRSLGELGAKLEVVVTEEMNRRYPKLRPSKAIVITRTGRFEKHVDEATGAPELPQSDDGLRAKFLTLVTPVLGADRAKAALDRFWNIEAETDVTNLLQSLTP